jgi:hypothetical protein
LVQAAETVAVSVTAGETLQEWCQSGGFNGSDAANAGITAIRVLFFTGTPPARHGTPSRPPSVMRPCPQHTVTSLAGNPAASSTHRQPAHQRDRAVSVMGGPTTAKGCAAPNGTIRPLGTRIGAWPWSGRSGSEPPLGRLWALAPALT